MTENDQELLPPAARNKMNPEEQALADEFYDALMRASRYSPRSKQAAELKIGISDLGYCSERLRRTLLGQQPEDTDELLAWLGTALGDHAERAYVALYPHVITQATVEVPLQGEQNLYTLTGHPDIIDPKRGYLLDGKTSYGFSTVRRIGPSQQQQFQRHGYAYGAWRKGMFGNRPLEEIKVGNVWIDRAGIERSCHVHLEPFNMDWVNRAAEWLDEVVYAYLQSSGGIETVAQKEPPREVCKATCGFYSTCRALDTDVTGLITDEAALAALDTYVYANAMTRVGDRLKKEAKVTLTGIEGSNGKHLLRWVWVNETETRAGYYKIDIKEIPGR